MQQDWDIDKIVLLRTPKMLAPKYISQKSHYRKTYVASTQKLQEVECSPGHQDVMVFCCGP